MLKILIIFSTLFAVSYGQFHGMHWGLDPFNWPPRIDATFMLRLQWRVNGKIYNMSNDIITDIFMRHRIIDRYMDMHKNSWDWEVGQISGSIHHHFRSMLRWYKKLSDLRNLELYGQGNYLTSWYKFDTKSLRKYYYYFQLCHGEFTEILYNCRLYFQVLEEYMSTIKYRLNKRISVNWRRAPKDDKLPPTRTDKDSVKLEDFMDTLEFMEKDKDMKKTKKFGNNTLALRKYMETHFEAFQRKHKNLTKLAEKRAKLHAQNLDRYLDTSIVDDKLLEPLEREWELRVKEREREDKEFRKQNPGASHKIKDDKEYKRMLRMKSYEKQRGKFIPNREGIDIDLKDMV